MAMVDAIKSLPGADPDRASLTVALQAARDQLVCADHALSDPSDCTVSGIATAVPSALLPSRRSRTSARKVKCPTSRYPAHPTSERPLTSQNIIGLAIEIQTQLPASATHSHSGQRNQVLQLMRTEPHRPWHARELATALAYAQHGSFCVQLGRWAREGLLDRTADATYRLAPDCLPPEASPTDSQCP
ncbi:hypothetical protein SAV14893_082180 [Streptomyces avermitilis]|nr:hypothetical protein SAV14893_082180 [Streptomyces avermitilis]